ncbi:type II toxin-antitoxin system RelE/ParE family toxin [Pedobacter sp. MC2016-05]|uniref:type II toxin-antitoxin system RelE/ParE family toxin n=1 Tax=Pedobacter sp. MC2016-05 TaxID=2994474 RepID=UPI002246155B|nr:type II toxin-antitoxin system RelE/ParE family toxin [Pedobacter sp. MC2016-05]MCX2476757.1 type II toxin-antitoxin system RelE/ParE family toxin [Pedobacter sp. MC2016-05]
MGSRLKYKPTTGSDLGNGVFRIRLAVKGKSGGYRFITYLHTEDDITMVYIYNKSEEVTVSKKDIQKIIDSL